MLCPPAPSQRLALSACLVWAALGLAIVVRAGESDTNEPGEEAQAAREGILIMRTGAIVTGKILKSGNIYEVQCPTGRMAVPVSLVKMRCANLSEGYEKLRASAKAQNAADAHLTLARWCLANHLEKEARRELEDALALEPDREDAKKLLRDVEDVLKKKSAPIRTAHHEESVRTARIAAASDDSVSLGGLSRENAAQFARRIQPLLVGTCTAAGCHGRDSQTDFRLTRVTPGKDTNRHAAERNLAEVLGQIDVAKPRSSPLLTVPRGNHGRRGRQIFAGQRGEEQLAELRSWVIAVSKEEIVRQKLGKSRDGLIRQVSGREESQEETQTQPAGSLPVAKSPAPSASEKIKLPQAPLPAVRDPFDPAAFNRGASARAKR